MKLKITIDGKSYEAEVEILDEETPQLTAYPPLPLAAPPIPVAEIGDDNSCLSPVMGLVIRINVSKGQTVKANDVIMVLESMKMETNIVAPRDGVVKAVHATVGNPVKLNQLLIEFE